MAEIKYHDGSAELKNHEELFGKLTSEPKFSILSELLKMQEVKSVTLHKPGEIVEKDGKWHIVMEDGSWRECVKMANGEVYLVSEDGRLHLYKERDC